MNSGVNNIIRKRFMLFLFGIGGFGFFLFIEVFKIC